MITVVVNIAMAIFGVPKWARDRFHALWGWFREFVRQQPDPAAAEIDGLAVAQAIGDADTVNATTGGTDRDITDAPQIHDTRRAPTPFTQEQREEVLAGAGAKVEDHSKERPLEFNDDDLELQETAPLGHVLQRPAGAVEQHDIEHVNGEASTRGGTRVLPIIIQAVHKVQPNSNVPASSPEASTPTNKTCEEKLVAKEPSVGTGDGGSSDTNHPRQGFDGTQNQASGTAHDTSDTVVHSSESGDEQQTDFQPATSISPTVADDFQSQQHGSPNAHFGKSNTF